MNKFLIFLVLFLININVYAQIDNNTTTKNGNWRIDNGTNYAIEYYENGTLLTNKYIANAAFNPFSNAVIAATSSLLDKIVVETNRSIQNDNAITNFVTNSLYLQSLTNADFVIRITDLKTNKYLFAGTGMSFRIDGTTTYIDNVSVIDTNASYTWTNMQIFSNITFGGMPRTNWPTEGGAGTITNMKSTDGSIVWTNSGGPQPDGSITNFLQSQGYESNSIAIVADTNIQFRTDGTTNYISAMPSNGLFYLKSTYRIAVTSENFEIQYYNGVSWSNLAKYIP